MLNTNTSPAAAQLAAYDRTPRNAEVARRIEFAERQLLDSLKEIQRRIEGLLEDYENGRPYEAITTIVQTAGAAGPVGSQWEKAVAKAVELESLMLYACHQVGE